MSLCAPYREKDIELIFTDQAGKSSAVPMAQPSTSMNEDTRKGAFNSLVEEFINGRHGECPDFYAGLAAQNVIAAIFQSIKNDRMVEL
jgi:hypothetical protein